MAIALSYLFIAGPMLFFTGNLEFLKDAVPPGLEHDEFMRFAANSHYFSYVGMTVVMPFIVALLVAPYRVGCLTVVGFLAAVELLSFAPVVGEHIRQFSDYVFELKNPAS